MAFIAINTIHYGLLPCQPRALHTCQYESDVGPCLVVPFAPIAHSFTHRTSDSSVKGRSRIFGPTCEVKIDREYLQWCGVHGGDMLRPLVGEVGGGSYVMAKTMGYIRRRFYDTTEDIRRRSSTASDSDSSSAGLLFNVPG